MDFNPEENHLDPKAKMLLAENSQCTHGHSASRNRAYMESKRAETASERASERETEAEAEAERERERGRRCRWSRRSCPI